MLMKPVLLLALYCSCFFLVSGQVHPKENLLQKYIAKDPVVSTCWLVKIKTDSVDAYLINNRDRIVRRLSPTDFIIAKNGLNNTWSNAFLVPPSAANNYWKLSPRLSASDEHLTSNEKEMHDFYIQSDDIQGIKKIISRQAKPVTTVVYEYGDLLQLRTNYEFIANEILTNEHVHFIDMIAQPPKEEVNLAGFDNSLNKVNLLHYTYPAMDGKNTVVSVKENRPDTADIDFKGRYLSTTAASNILSTHATIMSTIIAGGGNSFYTARGVAPAGRISSSSFAVLLPDSDAFYQRYQVTVQNHSYGTGIENFYGADAAAYDASVNSNPALLHVFSSGNAGDQAAVDGQYAGINGFANLTGSFKMAKNIITTGSVDSFGIVPPLSSKGPAYDGRVKPELVAFGEDGSSGAAALVAGTAMVLQQAYKEQHAGVLPDAALVKAVLLNTAVEAGNKGIDFSSGYGNLDAYRAVTAMKLGQFFTAAVSQGQSQTFTLTVPNGSTNLKILLAWTDKPAAANAYTALVNDLDLTVTHTASAQQWLPWVLRSSPVKDSLQLLPVQKRDSLNTVEQVTIDDPAGGDYSIQISGYNVPAGTQKFFIVYQWDAANTFQWVYPSGKDNLLPGKQQVLRWQNNYSGNGLLEYTFAGSGTWKPLNNNLTLSGNYTQWLVPDTNAVAILRMTINAKQYLSDSFTISAPLQTGVGFNCPDAALLYWNRGITGNYKVSRLGDQFMEQFVQTTDTAVIIDKAVNSSTWYSVAPLLSYNKTGIQSQAFDYSTQGVDCYIKSFTADPVGNTASLVISLGTTFRVVRMVIEKADRNGVYQPLQIFMLPIQTQYHVADNHLTKGVNSYRLRIELATGNTIYSDVEIVYYLAGDKYIVYPNPVKRQQLITVLAEELGNQVLQLYNSFGQKIVEKKMTDLSLQIATGALAKGVYFYIIVKDGKKDATGRIIIQ